MESNLILAPPLKYNLASRFNRMPRKKYLMIRLRIMQDHNVPASTWDRWLKIPADSHAEIKVGVLIALAEILDVPIAQLINPKPKQ